MRFVPAISELKIGNIRDVFTGYSQHRRVAFRQQIRLGTDPYQVRYKRLSPGYAQSKQRRYGSKPILEASGQMVRSHKVALRTPHTITESLRSPAASHAMGDPSTRLPKRPPLADHRGLPANDRKALWDAVLKSARRSFR